MAQVHMFDGAYEVETDYRQVGQDPGEHIILGIYTSPPEEHGASETVTVEEMARRENTSVEAIMAEINERVRDAWCSADERATEDRWGR
jgi:hypothetical protein